MKPTEDNIVARLRELADADLARQAPARVETELLTVLRSRTPHRRGGGRRRPEFVFFAVAAFVFLILGVAWLATLYRAPAPQLAFTLPPPPPAPAVAAAVRPAARAAQPGLARQLPEDVALTEFIQLMPEDLFNSDAPARLVRVRLPRAALASFGLPVSEERLEERVNADLLLGHDGCARAIRLVSAR